MGRAGLLQEIRKMRFEEVYRGWNESRLTQEQAATILGVSDRTFRRYIDRYESEGIEGLEDRRIGKPSFRRAPVDEVMAIVDDYQEHHQGWRVRHYHRWYQRGGGTRSYTWIKKTLQERGLVSKEPKRGVHRKRRDRAPIAGMMLHQDGSRHEWVRGKQWDLIVTMDDATSEHYSMFFVEEEGTTSSFQGVREVILRKGRFSSLYTDRGSHYWFTPKEGGKVSKTQLTQFGRAMNRLGIQMIAAYSPEARGRSERAFQTHQQRLVRELAFHGITDMKAANQYLSKVYLPAFNEEFMQPAREEGSLFVPWTEGNLDNILCEQHERSVTADNCVTFRGTVLQIPQNRYRCNYVRARVRVHRYIDGTLAIFHGPTKLADYDRNGKLKEFKKAA